MNTAYVKGRLGEHTALVFLEAKGYQLERRNFRAPGGEIDLIMRDGDVLVFVEVKTRSKGARGSGLEAIDARKRQRLVAAAVQYLAQIGDMQRLCRFDVVECSQDGILHIVHAFDR